MNSYVTNGNHRLNGLDFDFQKICQTITASSTETVDFLLRGFLKELEIFWKLLHCRESHCWFDSNRIFRCLDITCHLVSSLVLLDGLLNSCTYIENMLFLLTIERVEASVEKSYIELRRCAYILTIVHASYRFPRDNK